MSCFANWRMCNWKQSAYMCVCVRTCVCVCVRVHKCREFLFAKDCCKCCHDTAIGQIKRDLFFFFFFFFACTGKCGCRHSRTTPMKQVTHGVTKHTHTHTHTRTHTHTHTRAHTRTHTHTHAHTQTEPPLFTLHWFFLLCATRAASSAPGKHGSRAAAGQR